MAQVTSNDRLVAKYEISEEQCLMIEALSYKRDGWLDAVTNFATTPGMNVDSENYKRIMEKYEEVNTEFMIAYNGILRQYLKEEHMRGYKTEISFIHTAILVFENCAGGACRC